MTNMNVLFVASECAPFVKTGGLADVIGALPRTLGQLGVCVKVMVPAYPAFQNIERKAKSVWSSKNLFGGKAELRAVKAEGLDLLLLDAPHLYDRPGSIYLDNCGNDWPDNHLRFAGLCRAAAEVALGGAAIGGGARWKPDIVHGHDWQAGLTSAYLNQAAEKTTKTVFTIHNMAFQGLFNRAAFDSLGLPNEMFRLELLEYWGKVGFLKGGIALADQITTVSPTYAEELMAADNGMGLEGLMRARRNDVTGILNGIDLDVWNPATDDALLRNYTSRSLKRKAVNRAAIEDRFELEPDPTAPLFCVVSRLTAQKGLDVLLEILPHLVARRAKFALLGSGDSDLEERFRQAAESYRGDVGVVIGYDEELSHLLQGSADAIIVPSRFEPCGLTQLYGLRYATLPVVAETGGLADTVVDATVANLKSKKATGFTFAPLTSSNLAKAVDRACELFAEPDMWAAMQRAAMRYPVGWEQSATAYLELYEGLIDSESSPASADTAAASEQANRVRPQG